MLCAPRILENRCLFHVYQLQWGGPDANEFALMLYCGGKCNNIL